MCKGEIQRVKKKILVHKILLFKNCDFMKFLEQASRENK